MAAKSKGNEEEVPISPVDLLRHQLEMHRRGTKEGPAVDAHRIAELQQQLAELVERGAGILEAIEGRDRLEESLRGDPLDLAVAQLGVSMRTLNALEGCGVIWVRELIQWTEPMVLATAGLNAAAASEIKAALDSLGLSLRVAEPAPPKPVHPRGAQAKKLAAVLLAPIGDVRLRQRAMLIALARGASEREANIAVGLSPGAHYAPGSLKRRIRHQLASAAAPSEIIGQFGQFDEATHRTLVRYVESLR